MKNFLKILLSAAVVYCLVQAMQDFYLIRTANIWSKKYDLLWVVGLAGVILFCAAGFVVFMLAVWQPARLERLRLSSIHLRQRLGRWRVLLAVLTALLPIIILLYSFPGVLLTAQYLRWLIGCAVILILAVLITHNDRQLIELPSAIFALLSFSSLYGVASYLTYVQNYPFGLFWSEGNRLYDYSVILGSNRYDYPGKLTLPYYAPGRYTLWGILYLLPDTPIWLHRLWDAVLWTAPQLLLGYLIARKSRFEQIARWGLVLWVFLFLYQGPIYAPLVLSAIIIVLTVSRKRLWLALIGVAVAGYYASASRWTWMPAPAMWAVLILVSEIELEKGRNWKQAFRQLWPAVLVGSVGIAAGILQNASFFTPQSISSSTPLNQPLLWYRLLPNATYSSGILLGILLAAGPLAIVLAWSALSGSWRLNWLQALIYSAAGLGTLVVGLVVSVKIGGGSNLHNLDMFLITLVVLLGLMIKDRQALPWRSWPVFMQASLALMLLIPAADALRKGEPMRLPSGSVVQEALETIRTQVASAEALGEVLFLDQRQLLTFGYVKDVPLVADYEKKFLMDMAMEGNQEYFKVFYADLAQQRFKLIVSEPLKLVEKAQIDSFGEENNAWVTWVSNPMLCYYKPLVTLKQIQVQLLVPRAAPQNCP